MRTALVAVLALVVGVLGALVWTRSPAPLAWAGEPAKPERITGAYGNVGTMVLKDAETGQEFLVVQLQTLKGVAIAVSPITAKK